MSIALANMMNVVVHKNKKMAAIERYFKAALRRIIIERINIRLIV